MDRTAGCPLLRSLLDVKRTCAVAAHVSAFRAEADMFEMAPRPQSHQLSKLEAQLSDCASLFVGEALRRSNRRATWHLLGVLALVGDVAFTLRFAGTPLSDLASNKPPLERDAKNKPETENVVGKAKVLDGDTIEISGKRIRLFGIDAPENGQTCAIRRKQFAVIKPLRLRWSRRLALA